MSAPPQVLRIKRKRNEEPLPALVFEGVPSKKRSRISPEYVFKFAETTDKADKNQAVLSPADGDDDGEGRKTFSIPKSASEDSGKAVEEPQVNPELLAMVQDYLQTDEGREEERNNAKRRKSSCAGKRPSMVSPKKQAGDENAIESDDEDSGPDGLAAGGRAVAEARADDIVLRHKRRESDEYVYDVYYRDTSERENSLSSVLQNNVGYVRFADDDLELVEDDEPDTTVLEDDEDSNSEGWYQNDYPDEDEVLDAESETESMGIDNPSDDQDDEFEIVTDPKRFSPLEVAEADGLGNSAAAEDYERAVRGSSDMMDMDES